MMSFEHNFRNDIHEMNKEKKRRARNNKLMFFFNGLELEMTYVYVKYSSCRGTM